MSKGAGNYKIHIYLGTDCDGIPIHEYVEFYAESEEKALERYEEEKSYRKYFEGFMTKEESRVIISNLKPKCPPSPLINAEGRD
jgi:hypothetical protein